jgi:hypothetical protein
MTRNFAVIDPETSTVENVILANDDFTVDGKILIASDDASIGDLYDAETGEFTRPEPEQPLPSEIDYQIAIEKYVDAVASEKRYGGAVAIATYINSTVDVWRNEAKTFVAWRDNVYVYAFEELQKVMNGERQQPSVEDFLAELPSITWPNAE